MPLVVGAPFVILGIYAVFLHNDFIYGPILTVMGGSIALYNATSIILVQKNSVNYWRYFIKVWSISQDRIVLRKGIGAGIFPTYIFSDVDSRIEHVIPRHLFKESDLEQLLSKNKR